MLTTVLTMLDPSMPEWYILGAMYVIGFLATTIGIPIGIVIYYFYNKHYYRKMAIRWLKNSNKPITEENIKIYEGILLQTRNH